MSNPTPDEAGPAVEATRVDDPHDDDAVDDALRALRCLYLAVDADVADNVTTLVRAAFAELNAEIAALRSPSSPSDEPSDERKYPCDRCGTMRTKAEGGNIFTLCDECWNRTPEIQPPAPDEPSRERFEKALSEFERQAEAAAVTRHADMLSAADYARFARTTRAEVLALYDEAASRSPAPPVTDEDVLSAIELYQQRYNGYGDHIADAFRRVLEDFASRQGEK